MSKETFIRRFQSGLVCKMAFTVEGKEIADWRCEWSRKLTANRVRRVLAEYREWRDESFRQVREKYGMGKMLMIETGDRVTISVLGNPTCPRCAD